jgi:hypothetical protein
MGGEGGGSYLLGENLDGVGEESEVGGQGVAGFEGGLLHAACEGGDRGELGRRGRGSGGGGGGGGGGVSTRMTAVSW